MDLVVAPFEQIIIKIELNIRRKARYSKNIRNDEKTSLEFSPCINLIVGANNSGKSTFTSLTGKIDRGIYLLTEVSSEPLKRRLMSADKWRTLCIRD
jgi:predicted AAA+ superfamily ATPase